MGDGCFWILLGIIAFIWISLEPISGLIVLGLLIIIFVIIGVTKSNKFDRESKELIEKVKELECMFPQENNKDITLSKIKEKPNITSLEDLYTWIHANTSFLVAENDENHFILEAINKADLEIAINENHDINVNINKIIRQLEKFDASDNYTDSWNEDFTRKYNIYGIPFYQITQHNEMWDEAESEFRALAEDLKELLKENFQSEKDDVLLDSDEYLFDIDDDVLDSDDMNF
jgi:preprotein translocase subunit YajC